MCELLSTKFKKKQNQTISFRNTYICTKNSFQNMEETKIHIQNSWYWPALGEM